MAMRKNVPALYCSFCRPWNKMIYTPRIECDGETIDLDTRKATALMAYLAVTRQRHSRDALAALQQEPQS
jgi:hypothetical protein